MRRAASLKVQDVQSVFFDLEGFLHYVRRIYRVYREHKTYTTAAPIYLDRALVYCLNDPKNSYIAISTLILLLFRNSSHLFGSGIC